MPHSAEKTASLRARQFACSRERAKQDLKERARKPREEVARELQNVYSLPTL